MNRRRRRPAPIVAVINRQAGASQTAIVAELRRAITDGHGRPGTPLPVDELADAFGVSLIPVREALKTLLGEGLVDHRPRAGYIVARLTHAEYTELYIARSALEQTTLSRAALVATPDDIANARAIQDDLTKALEEGNTTMWHRHSRTLHEALVAPCRMHRLLALLSNTWNLTQPVPSMTWVEPEQLWLMHREHDELLEHFASGDIDDLVRLAAAHGERLIDEVAALPTDHTFFAEPTDIFEEQQM